MDDYKKAVALAKLRAGLELTIADWARVLERNRCTVQRWVDDGGGTPPDEVRPLRYRAGTMRRALTDRAQLAPWFDEMVEELTA